MAGFPLHGERAAIMSHRTDEWYRNRSMPVKTENIRAVAARNPLHVRPFGPAIYRAAVNNNGLIFLGVTVASYAI
jgi:hypothetical protein